MSRAHSERHSISRIGWLRAAVLGANDGIISTSSLIVGIAANGASTVQVVLVGTAGLVAGAMSMAAGEFVSVSSQLDTERADLIREKNELTTNPELETEELAALYQRRGVDAETSLVVARQLMAKDALDAHAREELGIHEMTSARPLQAAITSALTFGWGASLPILIAILLPSPLIAPTVSAMSLIFLAALGALGARAGGAPLAASITRVTVWGALAMAATYAVGLIFGAAPA